MYKRIVALLFAFALLFGGAAQGALTAMDQVNQTRADVNNGGADLWTTFSTSGLTFVTEGDAQVLVINTSTTSSAYDTLVNISAGPGIQGDAMGGLSYSLDANRTYVLGPWETSRIGQANGTAVVTTNSTRGKLFCLTVP